VGLTVAIPVSGGASWIRVSAARRDERWYGLGEIRFLVSEHAVKVGLSVIGFVKDAFGNEI